MFSRSLAVLQRASNNGVRQKILAVTPTMQVYNLQADPTNGSLTRFTSANRGIRITVLPQLGQPHTDPEDETPQFDTSRRVVSTLNPKESAGLLSVFDGKSTEYKIQSEHRLISLSQTGPKSYKLSGHLNRTDGETIPVDLTLEKATLTTFKNFLESSIDEGFGFVQHLNPPQKFVERRYDQRIRLERRELDRINNYRDGNSSNNNNNRSSNNNKDGNNNNNNNNNSSNNNRNRNNNNNNTNNNNNNRNNNNNNTKNGNKNNNNNTPNNNKKTTESTAESK